MSCMMMKPQNKAKFSYRVSLFKLAKVASKLVTDIPPPHLPFSRMQLQCNPISEVQEQGQKDKAVGRMMKLYHSPQELSPDRCSSKIVQAIDAPLPLVWSVVRRFDKPQAYKQFVKNCTMSTGDGTAVGSVRELVLVSGLPAERSTERLDRLDDDLHVMIVSIIGGDHKLVNYQSTMTLHKDDVGNGDKTMLIESYVVDIPVDSCREDTCFFADTIIGYNLRTLAKMTKQMACPIPT